MYEFILNLTELKSLKLLTFTVRHMEAIPFHIVSLFLKIVKFSAICIS